MSNLISNVFVAARNEGKYVNVSVDAIKAAIASVPNAWNDAKFVQAIGDAYKRGRLCTALNLKGEAQAIVIFDLKPHKDGANDGHRTFAQHQACRAAISAWSNIRMRCGAPSAQTGAKRKARPSTNAPESKGETMPDNLLPAITRAKTVADVHAYALRVAQNMTKYLNANGKLATGAVGETMRAFVTAVPVQIAADSKPVETAKAA